MNGPLIEVRMWPQIQADLERGLKAYYVDLGDWWDIVCVDSLSTCNLPKLAHYNQQPPEVQTNFPRAWCEAFESRYQPKCTQGYPRN